MKTTSQQLRRRGAMFFTITAAIALSLTPVYSFAQELSETVKAQIAALITEKQSRTPAQQKMSSVLIQLGKETQGRVMAAGVALPSARLSVTIDKQNRVEVDITATVSDALLNAITQGGGSIVNQFPQYDAIRAHVLPGALEGLAARADVRSIAPASQPITNVGTVTSEGDVTHIAGAVRNAYGVTGAGITVGVLSDGVDSLAASKASGDLNAAAAAIIANNPGPGPSSQAGSGNEGTAMMEIVQDIVPNATVLFATGFAGEASMAANIIALQAQGCQIIVDDVTYPVESPFQDGSPTLAGGRIASAVNTVSAAGVLFFSSAANSGNLNDGTSGTWEGDWNDSGVAAAAPLTTAGNLHNFGGANFNTITSLGNSQQFGLFWTDPLGASSNDYDLFHTDSTGTVLKGASTNTQSGTQNPFESIGGPLAVGDRVYIVKKAGAAGRYLHLHAGRCTFSIGTTGNTRGHNASGAANAFSIAAVPSNVQRQAGEPTGPFPKAYTSAQLSEVFTSDGPRRYFFNAAGTALTPGNFSSTGGVLMAKPDFSAADGNVTSLPGASGFNPFFGTSSAAPHAAGIAALLLSYKPTLTAAQIRTALTSTAIDIEGPGWDAATGAGIIMAQAALASVTPMGPVASALGDVVTGGFAPNGAGANDGTKFDVLKRGGALAENGHLVFPGNLLVGTGGVTASTAMGLWKKGTGNLSLLARSGNAAPEATGATHDVLPVVPAINDSGEVTFLASLLVGSGAPATTVTTDTGLWSELGSTGLGILLREGDPVPSIAGATVGAFASGAYATAKTGASTGEAVFSITMKGTTTDTAILRASITGPTVTAVQVVARENTAMPGVAGEFFGPLASSYSDPAHMDATGNVVFGAVSKTNKESIWYQPVAPAGGSPAKVFITGETAPGTGGATFKSMKSATIGSGGVITFRGFLNADGDNAGNLRNDGIWRGTGSNAASYTSILRRGDAGLPGMAVGSKVGNLWHSWLTNGNRGAWLGQYDANGDGSSIPAAGDVYAIYSDASGVMSLVIKAGDAAPNVAGATLASFDLPIVGGVEQLVFLGKLTLGGGVTAANNQGIWRSGPNGGALSLVLRTGDTMTTSQGLKTIAKLDFPGSNSTQRRWEQPVMDGTGRLLVFVTFTDGTTCEVIVP